MNLQLGTMMKIITRSFGITLIFSLSGTVFAGTMGPSVPKTGTSVITLSAGPAWTNTNTTQTFFLQPDIEKTYLASNHYHALAMGDLFFGWQKFFNPIFLSQVGISFGATSNATIAGDIWEDSNPDFDNFYYSYKVNHARVALKGKLLVDKGQWVMPYINGSVGLGFNRAHNFLITPKIFEEVPAPDFNSHTQTTWTYTLGIGLQRALNPNWQAGVGYEFANLGQTQLVAATGQTLNSGLSLPHLYTHGIQFSLSYTV